MIAFCESGSYSELNAAIKKLLDGKSRKTSKRTKNYGHNLIYDSSFDTINHQEITIVSILMNFT